MPPQTVTVQSDVIKWARLSINMTPRAAAKAIQVPEETLLAWEENENGVGTPTLGQLRRMGKAYKRPVTALMQPDIPPRASVMPKDYRTIGGLAPRLTPDALLAIRDAERVQMIAAELTEAEEEIMPPLRIVHHDRGDSALEAGMLDRADFNIDYKVQTKWTLNRAYNAWRTRLQMAGVLVLAKPMHPKDCRGFTLTGRVPAIVVNSREIDQAKIFTLFHEYAHLTLNQDALCQERNTFNDEKWCNRYAASFLVPGDWLRLNVAFAKVTSTKEVERLAHLFKVSRHVIALRLRDIGRADDDLYKRIKAEDDAMTFRQRKEGEEEKEEQNGGPNQARRRLTELGVGYASAILDAVNRGVVDLREAGDYLNIGPYSFDPLEKNVRDTLTRYG